MFERFTKSARTAVEAAYAQSREMGVPAIDVEQLFYAVVDNSDGRLRQLLDEHGLTAEAVREELESFNQDTALGDLDADALKSIGIDLDAVRASLDATFGEGALDQEPPSSRSWFPKLRSRITDAGKKALELSLREAIRVKSREIGVEHLLLGILRAPNAKVTAIVERHVPILVLRQSVEALTPRAA